MHSEHDDETAHAIDPSASPDHALRGAADWPRIDAALDEILGLPEGEWAAACERVSGGDASLHAELASLLACAGGEDRLLDSPRTLPLGAIDIESPGLAPGSLIGAYRIERLIGRGGARAAGPGRSRRGEERRAVGLLRRDPRRRHEAETQGGYPEGMERARFHEGGVTMLDAPGPVK